MKRFIIIGLGTFGSAVAEALQALGHEVAGLDRNPERVDEMGRVITAAGVGDGTEARALRRIGAEGADAAVVSTGDNITASAMAALVLRDLGVKEVYVKVTSLEHARLIERIGVTETIFPERESGVRLGKRISSRAILNYVSLGPDFGLQEMAVPDRWLGKSLRELELPRRHGISVVAIHDNLGDRIVPVPDPDEPLKDSDSLLVAGTDRSLASVVKGED